MEMIENLEILKKIIHEEKLEAEIEVPRAILDDKVLEAHMRVNLSNRFTAGTGRQPN